jgi:methylated-DNA-protein-cysteine methyltransferase related protein
LGRNERQAHPSTAAGGGSSSHDRIYQAVRRIPAGRVCTYGDVATLAGLPRQARLVGYALFALPDHTTVPWHRVVNARGAISARSAHPHAELKQRRLLEAEGIVFDANGRISLERWRWRETGTPPSTTTRQRRSR